METVRPTAVRYIKLGPSGAWLRRCIDEGIVEFGHGDLPHEVAQNASRNDIARYLLNLGRTPAKGGRMFSYYISAAPKRGAGRRSAESVRRVSAPRLEGLVLDRLRRLFDDDDHARSELRKVHLAPDAVHILLDQSLLARRGAIAAIQAKLEPIDLVSQDADQVRITIPVRPVFRGGRTWLIAHNGRAAVTERRPDTTLVKALRNAHALQVSHNVSPFAAIEDHHQASSPEDSYRRALLGLGYLAPDIQQAIVQGRQPPGLTLQRLIELDLPFAWEDQRRLLGF